MGKTVGREFVGSTSPEMLLIGTAHPAIVGHVLIAAGQGAMKRGTILVENAEGKCFVLGTEGYVAPHTSSGGAAGILDTDAQEGGGTPASGTEEEEYISAYVLAEDQDEAEGDIAAAAYRGGDFNKGALIVKDGYKITPGDIAALRNGGIYLGNIMEY